MTISPSVLPIPGRTEGGAWSREQLVALLTHRARPSGSGVETVTGQRMYTHVMTRKSFGLMMRKLSVT